MKIPKLTVHALLALAAVGLSACSNDVAQSFPRINPEAVSPNAITVYPKTVSIKGIGELYEKTFKVTELGYTGPFNTSETYGCTQAALLEPSVGMGPKTTFTLTGKKKTTSPCSITFSDTKGHQVKLTFTVA